MKPLWLLIRRNPLLWMLVFVPVLFYAEHAAADRPTLVFFLSVAAVIPLAVLLTEATESVAARTGDLVGGLLNATLGNLTELVIAITALRAGLADLVKASIAGAIVTNTLFVLGLSFLVGGLRHRLLEFNSTNAHLQCGLMFVASIALLIPSLLEGVTPPNGSGFMSQLSVGLAVILLCCYALNLLFSLVTHREFFAARHAEKQSHEGLLPLPVAGLLLAVVTVLVALVSEVFVGSVQMASESMGMSPPFVGFIVVSLVGCAAEMAAAVSAARRNHCDLTVGISLGASTQMSLFVAPALLLLSFGVGPEPMTLSFSGGQVVMVILSSITGLIVTSNGKAAWFSGVMLLAVYALFGVTLYLLPQNPG